MSHPQLIPNPTTKICASLSAHSGHLGVDLHNFLYREMGLNFLYQNFQVTQLEAALNGVRALGMRGCTILMPYTEQCIPHLDTLDTSAWYVGAVNAVVNNEGVLRGYNTDYRALVNLIDRHQIDPTTPFAVFGAGGLARAVLCALKECQFKNGQIISRNEEKGQDLAQNYGFTWKVTLDPKEQAERPRFLINCTPIGMEGTDMSTQLPLAEELIETADWILDGVSKPAETPLIQKAKALNKKTINGMELLFLQATEEFELYTGRRPSPELVQKATEKLFYVK
jgi:shikimate dehydrogenase